MNEAKQLMPCTVVISCIESERVAELECMQALTAVVNNCIKTEYKSGNLTDDAINRIAIWFHDRYKLRTPHG